MDISRQRARAYSVIGAESELESASAERLVQMLLEGALDRIATAKGHVSRSELDLKGEHIGKAISIVEGLRSSLDPSVGEISSNLDDLYTYVQRRLLEANISGDTTILDEAAGLLREIKSAWDVLADSPVTA